ncbi:Dna2/Cas4 domain-containing protein [Litorilinea aerophila]|uniref:Dna2/Cas4 domain-containing protein n=1 Tax=Litorilinea aerophila TaxID=1204385 RepID=A0A540VM83_9CHLR|nr:Dna2/Cas4 domain-containing protein [Litorilinea aerophila]MCC9074574.1 Dna2/Cas4 domain-containing protein [Litorilinea aerophila]OUC05553.1 hypothetical protein RY27_26580 [Litorilinea aerophila]
MAYLFGFALLLLMLGGALLWLGRRTREQAGLPPGQVIYSDTGAWEAVTAPLVSRRHGLVGRPDYLVQHRVGGRTTVIPVEVKSRACPDTPYPSHVLQLAAYCLLVEDVYGQRPPHGLLHYADRTFQIPFTDELRRQVLAASDAIRRARSAPDVHQQHDEPARCRGCGYLHACDEGRRLLG